MPDWVKAHADLPINPRRVPIPGYKHLKTLPDGRYSYRTYDIRAGVFVGHKTEWYVVRSEEKP